MQKRTGQICALGVRVNAVPPIVNTKFWSFAKFALEIFRRPVALSSVAPVALWYLLNASDARYRRVVPVSTIPAVVERMVVLAPYRIDWSTPQ